MADRKPLKVLPDSASGTGGGDSTGIGEFVAGDTLGVVDGGTGLDTVATDNILTGNGTSALSAESNLTFDGSANVLSVGSNVDIRAGDTAAGDDAAIGYTAAEGLILTGQGSTNDITLKNDADATVMSVATGGTQTKFTGTGNITSLTASSGTEASMNFTPASNNAWQFGAGVLTAATFQLYENGAGAARITVKEGGDVGIGTAAPAGVGGTIVDVKGSGTNGASLSMGTTTAVTNARLSSISAYSGTTECVRIETGTEGGVNDTGSISFDTKVASGSLTRRMTINSAGAITTPTNPSFLCRYGSNHADATGDGSTVTLQGSVVEFDRGSNYTSSGGGNGQFTAPVAGIYRFHMKAYFNQTQSNHTNGAMNFVTSAGENSQQYFNPYNFMSSNTVMSIDHVQTYNMAANDTITATIQVSGGSKVIDLPGSTSHTCFFSGELIG